MESSSSSNQDIPSLLLLISHIALCQYIKTSEACLWALYYFVFQEVLSKFLQYRLKFWLEFHFCLNLEDA